MRDLRLFMKLVFRSIRQAVMKQNSIQNKIMIVVEKLNEIIDY